MGDASDLPKCILEKEQSVKDGRARGDVLLATIKQEQRGRRYGNPADLSSALKVLCEAEYLAAHGSDFDEWTLKDLSGRIEQKRNMILTERDARAIYRKFQEALAMVHEFAKDRDRYSGGPATTAIIDIVIPGVHPQLHEILTPTKEWAEWARRHNYNEAKGDLYRPVIAELFREGGFPLRIGWLTPREFAVVSLLLQLHREPDLRWLAKHCKPRGTACEVIDAETRIFKNSKGKSE